jgi:DNA-binding NarL/FixJ family response regulator
MISIGIIEDNYHLLSSFKEFLQDFRGFKVVFSYQSMEDFEKNIPGHPIPDVVLLDIRLPGKSGIDGVEVIKAIFPLCKVIMLTSMDQTEAVVTSLKKGASSYVIKSSRLHEIYDAIVNTLTGGSHLSPGAALKLVERVQEKKQNHLVNILSTREKMVVNSLQEGMTYKEIANKLNVTVYTINYHLKNVYKKLDVHSMTELMAKLYKEEMG